MLFIDGALLFTGLILLRKYCRIGFLVAQIFAGFAWAFVQYNPYFYDFVTGLTPIWVFASLAALAAKPKEKKRDY